MNSFLGRFVFLLGRLCFYVYPYNVDGNACTRFKRKVRIGWLSNLVNKFGHNSDIAFPVTIRGGKYISIGKNTSIAKSATITAWDRYEGDIFNPQIVIGDGVNIGEFSHITAINKIIIGNGVLTGRWITITDNSHGKIDEKSFAVPPIKRSLYSAGAVIIEDNVWIGDKVTILPNVHIGKNAVIGANAVVTKDVPENAIVVGSPATIVKIVDAIS
ncbi:MAG: acyltransferase [Paludibacteraceae bacterium]|nr:acyltransferase [Paludibacteraceae bacterium]